MREVGYSSRNQKQGFYVWETESRPKAFAASGLFRTTHWSNILAAGGEGTAGATTALEELCAVYWYPLYAHVRRRGYSPEDAQDLTQGFFASLLTTDFLDGIHPENGKFRSFLLAALNHFLAKDWRKLQAIKRGGGCAHFSLDAGEAEERYRLEPIDGASPEKIYERQWALTLLERSLLRLDREYSQADRADLFEALKGMLSGAPDQERYMEIARRLEMSEAAVKKAAQRLRDRYRELLREVVGETVSDSSQVDEELRHLVQALQS